MASSGEKFAQDGVFRRFLKQREASPTSSWPPSAARCPCGCCSSGRKRRSGGVDGGRVRGGANRSGGDRRAEGPGVVRLASGGETRRGGRRARGARGRSRAAARAAATKSGGYRWPSATRAGTRQATYTCVMTTKEAQPFRHTRSPRRWRLDTAQYAVSWRRAFAVDRRGCRHGAVHAHPTHLPGFANRRRTHARADDTTSTSRSRQIPAAHITPRRLPARQDHVEHPGSPCRRPAQVRTRFRRSTRPRPAPRAPDTVLAGPPMPRAAACCVGVRGGVRRRRCPTSRSRSRRRRSSRSTSHSTPSTSRSTRRPPRRLPPLRLGPAQRLVPRQQSVFGAHGVELPVRGADEHEAAGERAEGAVAGSNRYATRGTST